MKLSTWAGTMTMMVEKKPCSRSRRRLLWIGTLSSLCFLYLLSYGLVLPLAEYLSMENLAYRIYTPVEFARFYSDWAWKLTEDAYGITGGHVAVQKRFVGKGRRRQLSWHWNGVKFEETQYVDGNINVEMTWDKSGRLVTQGVVRDSRSWSGSFLEMEGGGLADYTFAVLNLTDGQKTGRKEISPELFDVGRSPRGSTIEQINWYQYIFLLYLLMIAAAAIGSAYLLYRCGRQLILSRA